MLQSNESAAAMNDHSDAKLAALKLVSAWGGTGLSYYLEKVGFRDWGDVRRFSRRATR